MIFIDKDIADAQALVIDENATSRSVMVSQLRDLGVTQVRHTGRISDARLWLEHRPYDIVLCDYHFDGDAMSGQDLLDELRRENLLPHSTVFIMVTGEATYAKVVEAAESALDGYLLKPYTGAALADRLTEARKRKRSLKEIFDALESKQTEKAIQLCLTRFAKHETYWLFAARMATELLLRANRNDDARSTCEAVLRVHNAAWARLGISRALLAAGETAAARRSVESQLQLEPEYADSYDVLGRLQVDQGELGAALNTYRSAIMITPGCLLRLQHCGTLAFYQGHSAEARRLLDRCVAIGLKSKLFDALTLYLLALLRFDAADAKGLQISHDQLRLYATRNPDSLRLQRFIAAATALRQISAKPDDAMGLARSLAETANAPDFDLEAANLVLALWVRLPAQALQPGELEALARRIGLRYCISKALTEVLLASAQAKEPVAGVVRNCQTEIAAMAEQAMTHSMRGQPKAAVQTLLEQGEQTRNAKLIEMAALVAQRHHEAIQDQGILLAQARELQQRYCLPITHIAGIRRTGRSPGGLMLRA